MQLLLSNRFTGSHRLCYRLDNYRLLTTPNHICGGLSTAPLFFPRPRADHIGADSGAFGSPTTTMHRHALCRLGVNALGIAFKVMPALFVYLIQKAVAVLRPCRPVGLLKFTDDYSAECDASHTAHVTIAAFALVGVFGAVLAAAVAIKLQRRKRDEGPPSVLGTAACFLTEAYKPEQWYTPSSTQCARHSFIACTHPQEVHSNHPSLTYPRTVSGTGVLWTSLAWCCSPQRSSWSNLILWCSECPRNLM